MQIDNPGKAALQIVKIVAFDPPITIAPFLISFNQKVTDFSHEKNEKLSNFVSCFRDLLAKDLLHS